MGFRDGRGHILCNTVGGGYDDYSAKSKGYGGTRGKGSETGCPRGYYGVGHVCIKTTAQDPGGYSYYLVNASSPGNY